ncbi:MAG: hypothetical protein ABSD20_16075 [Terriglobales bacterium]
MLKLVVNGSVKWVALGIALGVAGSFGLTRLLGTLLYEVKPSSPIVLGSASLLLASAGLLASYVPARRAAKVDPMAALRFEQMSVLSEGKALSGTLEESDFAFINSKSLGGGTEQRLQSMPPEFGSGA